VVALTANAVYGAREEFLEVGFDDYLAKPINIRQLEEILRKYLQMEENSENIEPHVRETVSLKGINCGEAMKKLHLDMDSYCLILKNYHKDLEKNLQRLQNAVEQGDFKRFVIDVHAVKSASAGIGAMNLAEYAQGLETAGKEENTEYIENHFKEFVQCGEKVLQVLDTYFKNTGTDVPEKTPGVLERTWLDAMRKACEDMDYSVAEELLEQVKNKRFAEKEEKLVKQIEEYVDQFDYDEVVALLAEG